MSVHLPRRLGVRLALIVIVTLCGILSATLIHVSWQRIASRNARDLVDLINSQIVASIKGEVAAVLENAEAAREMARSVFYQNAIAVTDEAKREFVFLALLQSQKNLSWISFGWPDGSFFGAQKHEESEIRMVEVRRHAGSTGGERRIDTYTALAGDIAFLGRETAESTFDALVQPWYRKAMDADAPVWSETSVFPTQIRSGLSTSTPLRIYNDLVGVISVSLEFGRLSRFLTDLNVGRTGAAYIVAPDGRILAAPIDGGARTEAEAAPVSWRRLETDPDPLVQAAARAWSMVRIDASTMRDPTRVEVEGAEGNRYLVGFAPLPFDHWVVVTILPTADFLAEIDRTTQNLIWALILFVAIVAAAGTLIADRLVSRPLRALSAQLRHIETFRLDRIARVPSPLREIADLSATISHMARGLRSFQKFIPIDLVRMLLAQGGEAKPGGSRQELTILFADLAGFTGLSERLGESVVPMLAAHLGRVSTIVHETRGTVDKFIGDAVMAFWNAPEAVSGHALKACRAALQAQRATALHGMGLRMRIGINTGEVLVGNIGAEDRLNYTAIGDPVNLASRLEALNKVYGTEIILGEATRAAAGDAIVVRELDTVVVYGRHTGTRVYELLGVEGDAAVERRWIAFYEDGLAAYRAGDWDRAIGLFEAAIADRGSDQASEVLIGRCRRFSQAGPAADWAGVSVLAAK